MLDILIRSAADFSSIAGLFFSGYVLFQVRSLRRSYSLRATLPRAISDLRRQSEELMKLLSINPREMTRIVENIKLTRATLVNLNGKLEGVEKACLKKLKQKISDKQWFFFKNDLMQFNDDKLWEIYSDLLELTKLLSKLREDLKWSN